jgi:hypothetical protein
MKISNHIARRFITCSKTNSTKKGNTFAAKKLDDLLKSIKKPKPWIIGRDE